MEFEQPLKLADGIPIEPVKAFIATHGPILDIAYSPTDDAVILCLPYHLLPYHRASAHYSTAIQLPYRFQSATVIAGELYILAGEVIHKIAR